MVRQSQRQNYGRSKVNKSKSKNSNAFDKGKLTNARDRQHSKQQWHEKDEEEDNDDESRSSDTHSDLLVCDGEESTNASSDGDERNSGNENANPNSNNNRRKITKVLTQEEYILIERMRKNGGQLFLNDAPSCNSHSCTSGNSSHVSTLTSKSSSSAVMTGNSSSNRGRFEDHDELFANTSRRVRGSTMEFFENTMEDRSSYFQLNVEADKLMYSDLGVNRDILDAIDRKPHFAGLNIRGTIKPWYVKINGKLHSVSDELEALSKVCYSFQAVDMESVNMVPEVSVIREPRPALFFGALCWWWCDILVLF